MATIIRTDHNASNHFVMINKKSLWDKNLSLEAVGLWTRLLSRPDNWQINAEELATSCNCYVRGIYRILKELITHGYAYRHQEKSQNGKFAPVIYYVFEVPASKEYIQNILPHVQFPSGGSPSVGNCHTTNIDNTNIQEEIYTPSSTSENISQKKEYKYTERAKELTEYFISQSLKYNPERETPSPRIKHAWYYQMELLLRVDKTPEAKIKEVIDFMFISGHSQANFWANNIRSIQKFREQFQRLVENFATAKKQQVKFNPAIDIDRITKTNLDWIKETFRQKKPLCDKVGLNMQRVGATNIIKFESPRQKYAETLHLDNHKFRFYVEHIFKKHGII